jgi:nitrite reductase/ring-hydroxylating ferredoxin subunit
MAITQEQNDRLTRIEGGAPMGSMMRQHCWIPALLSVQLMADGAPRRVRLLGTDYVAFRDSKGRLGFLDEGCPHRNTSMVLARNEECGLRCIFHGWKIDVTGQVVEAPTHAPDSAAFAAKVRTRSYPIVEGGGLVWVWLGDEEPPPFPQLAFTVLPESHVWLSATPVACNWLQGVEATLDSAHVGTLHRAYIEAHSQKNSSASVKNTLSALAPRYEVAHTPWGIDAIAVRPMADGTSYVRTTNWVMPFVALVPSSPGTAGDLDGVIFIASPVDDTHHVLFYGFWSVNSEINDGLYISVPLGSETVVGDRPLDINNFGGFTADRDSNWGQNREAMARGHFSGFTGNLLQEDIITQLSMGPVTNRTREHLSSADVAVIHARRLLLDALDNVAAGMRPLRSEPPVDLLHVIPTDVVIPPSSAEERVGSPQ